MPMQKNLDSDFNDSHVPHIPRAARSVRRRSSLKSKGADQKTCAFDLLATVAGKLLSEGEDSPPSVGTSFQKEQPTLVEDSVEIKGELEQRSQNRDFHERNFLFTELVSQDHDSKFPFAQNDPISRPLSGITNSDGSENHDDCKLRIGILDVESSDFRLSQDESRKQIELDSENARSLSISNNRVNKTSTLVSSADSVKFPFFKDHAPCGSFPVNGDNNVNLVNKDDGDKFFEASNRNKGFRTLPRFGIRKSSASKVCSKLTPNVKDDERYNSDTERCNYLKKRESLKRQRSIKDYPFKKRKLYDSSSVFNYDEGISSDGICRQNGTNGGVMSSNPALQGVKLKIKSFRVPELIIEISETATVGSLKRTVMEAVNSVLGDGLRVGVIVQGKKIRDDNKTLFQTGISRDNKMDTTLGFALEPNPAQAPIQLCPKEQPRQLLHDSPQPLARYPAIPINGWNAVQQGNTNTPPTLSGNINYNNFIESDNDSAPSPRDDVSLQKTASESKALVVVPNNNMRPDALDIVPLRKSKRSESAQRRIRRPFAVSEVEALVQAVEKLGTGRWRDVKLRAFDNAKHRTYVDLKDKWKTLVHTARISPQQRRGEPVPQELLDRVLAAHAYWSHHQPKQQPQQLQQLKFEPNTSLLL